MNSPIMAYIILGVGIAYGGVRLEQKIAPPVGHAIVWTGKETAKGAVFPFKEGAALWFRIFPKK